MNRRSFMALLGLAPVVVPVAAKAVSAEAPPELPIEVYTSFASKFDLGPASASIAEIVTQRNALYARLQSKRA